MEVKVTAVMNGYQLECFDNYDGDPRNPVVCIGKRVYQSDRGDRVDYSEEKGEAEAIQELLYDVLESIGYHGNAYSKYTVSVNVVPGRKCEADEES